MQKYLQGDIVFIDLNPTKGMETNKKRPCVIVSNDNYNRLLNTIIVAPISHSQKYQNEEQYVESPLFIKIPENSKVEGTILLQHLRSIDPVARINSKVVYRLDAAIRNKLQEVIVNFF